MHTILFSIIFIFFIGHVSLGLAPFAAAASNVELKNWSLFSSTDPSTRYAYTAPATILGTLYKKDSLLTGYGMKTIQNEAPRFNVPWGFEGDFSSLLPTENPSNHRYQLRFLGINYRANLTVNGVLVATDKEFVGTLREFTFDVTHLVVGAAPAAPSLKMLLHMSRARDSAFPPTNEDTDLAFTFIDWGPPPPDNMMGMWKGAYLLISDPLSSAEPECRSAGELRFPVVDFKLPESEKSLTPKKSYHGATAKISLLWQLSQLEARTPPRGSFTAKCAIMLPHANISDALLVSLDGVVWKPTIDGATTMNLDLPLARFTHPILKEHMWWPWQMQLEQQQINISASEEFSASRATLQCGLYPPSTNTPCASTFLYERVGLREVESKLLPVVNNNVDGASSSSSSSSSSSTPRPTNSHTMQFFINGVPLLIRGAGWSFDLMMHKQEPTHWIKTLMMVRALGLNTLRQEGQFALDEFYSFCDQYGMVVIPGFSCCDAWQHWSAWGPEQHHVANESLRSLVRTFRRHASVVSFFRSSDEQPPPSVEHMYLATLKEERFPNPTISSASASPSPITGPSGVKMSGPYSWVPATYWDEGADRFAEGGAADPMPGVNGGGFGFLSEGGPGESPTLYESNLLMAGGNASLLTPELVNFHMGNPAGLFYNLRFYAPPFQARYGPPALATHDWFSLAQFMNFETMQSYSDSYSRSRFTGQQQRKSSNNNTRSVVSSGFIQWMLGGLWPSNLWSTYDYYNTWTGNAAAFQQSTGGWGAYPLGILRFADPQQKRHQQLSIVLSNNDLSRSYVNVTMRVTTLAIDVSSSPPSLVPIGSVQRRIPTLAPNAVMDDYIALTSESVPPVDPIRNKNRPVTIIHVETQGEHTKASSSSSSSSSAFSTQRVFWLSNIRRDTLNWSAANFYRTPVTDVDGVPQWADLTALTPLLLEPVVSKRGVKVQACVVSNVEPPLVRVTVSCCDGAGSGNSSSPSFSSSFALMLRLDIVYASTMQLARGVLWGGQESNMVSILPGQMLSTTRVLHVRLLEDAGKSPLLVKIRNETFPIHRS